MSDTTDNDTVRKMIRLPKATAARAEYWADQLGRDSGAKVSFNAFVAMAVENEVARRMGVVVDAETMVTGRLNQMVDALLELRQEVSTLATAVNTNYSFLMGLAQGDSILTDDPVVMGASAGFDVDGDLR